MRRVFWPNRSSLAAIKHLHRMNIACDIIHEIIVKAGPITVSKRGGQGLIIDKITMYKENRHAIANSILI